MLKFYLKFVVSYLYPVPMGRKLLKTIGCVLQSVLFFFYITVWLFTQNKHDM